MRIPMIVMAGAAAALAACAPVPDSGNVVTFEPIGPEARAERDAALEAPIGAPVSLPPPAQSAAAGASGTFGGPAGPQTSATLSPADPDAALDPTLRDDATFTGEQQPLATQIAPVVTGPYEVTPTVPVPERPRGETPGVVEYALATTHAVGTQIYERRFVSPERTARACNRYVSGDQAQAAFLRAGGPERDGQGLDPDGDGFACDWSPDAFRNAVNR